ncbi:MAG: carbon monoxide dehydrogenase subunit G [Gammaproteobacteria bacterium]|nr:carbon monoxide dehydrogenase subunit G [Gammaproteobacteria bacterium]
MDQSGEYRIPAERADVWRALNDPDTLKRCIDGCQSMERRPDGGFAAVVKARVGPVRAVFNAALDLADINPPESYTINVAVKGGPAGFARGSAAVTLAAQGEETMLRYAASANIGGKLAQIGSRLIDGAARKMADDFFKAFHAEMSGRTPNPAPRPQDDGRAAVPINIQVNT